MGSSGGSSGGGVSFGTTAGTATEGNDARLVGLVGDFLDTGEETVTRDTCGVGTGLGNSNLHLTYFTARKTETTTQVRTYNTTAAGATPTLSRVGLYLADSSGNGTLVAATASDTSFWTAANSNAIRAWTVPYAKIAGQRYAVGILCVTAAALPSLLCTTVLATPETLMSPLISGRIASQADLPATFTAASLVSQNARYFTAVLP